ncbi:2-keto-4-pentenoate hydratase [Undibacterium oligocarboniphilum]|uniref:2-keto-4-pentenoate hydratase n=1 Tax=Undibacterium oligocarboniphilum TaxID=666702 RepID=A0A850QLT7_9BURK|nr:2-keto-4-pentenoate hydratase [Undibacterium oligocarboniphilum]MBC3870653.1 2-keto-4-pentenoate hydratase [Undibacterium oligocarboniphilum]NVO78545.1 2-keto-4-pentenoate hydratase [Undibacterium oligocarboniphilum]
MTIMTDTDISAAARLLIQLRKNGETITALPPHYRPQDLETAFAIQQCVVQQMPMKTDGWKCGMPVEGKWVAAPISGDTIFRHTHRCPVWSCDGTVPVEPEIALMLAHDLPPRSTPYTPAEVDAAIADTHLALELIGSRYSHPQQMHFPDHLADSLLNQGLLLGPAIAAESAALPEQFMIEIHIEGQPPLILPGQHPDRNPRLPLYWLAEFLRQKNIGLSAGQIIITGSYAGSPSVPLNLPVEIRFGALGTISALFESRSSTCSTHSRP